MSATTAPSQPTRRPGRPQFEPTAEQRAYVRRQRLLGDTHERIAATMNIHVQTLRLRCAAELEHGTRDLLGRLAARAYEVARAGDSAMPEFILSRRGGWVAKQP